LATYKGLIKERFIYAVWRIKRTGIKQNPIYSILLKLWPEIRNTLVEYSISYNSLLKITILNIGPKVRILEIHIVYAGGSNT
jgi:hypothetical protein